MSPASWCCSPVPCSRSLVRCCVPPASRNDQCLEIFLYGAILFFGGGLLVAQLVGRRRRREENWPHPAILVPASKDAAKSVAANQGGATLLGYNVHKEPWLWPDIVRMKHGVIVGGTGAGKSTFLENIIAQDVMRRFGSRKMPMIIFDGKGEREFLDRLLAAHRGCRPPAGSARDRSNSPCGIGAI